MDDYILLDIIILLTEIRKKYYFDDKKAHYIIHHIDKNILSKLRNYIREVLDEKSIFKRYLIENPEKFL